MASVAAILVIAGTVYAKVETWRSGGPRARSPRRIATESSISDSGRVRLGHALAPLGSIGVERIWDLARTREGILLAATGDCGQGTGPRAQSRRGLERRLRCERLAGALAGRYARGISYAGTGPAGQLVNLTDPKHPASRPDPKVQYIWDLACDQQGNLWAATGPTGQLWKRTAEGVGRWSMTASRLICCAWRLALTDRSTPAATAKG